MWLGRGLTVGASGGIEGRRGPLSYAVRPIAFASQNAGFDPSESVAESGFGNPWSGGTIDKPYRFGAAAYLSVDPGESYLRLDGRWVSLGLSTAAQRWGPASLEPLMLSGEGGGFPHAFVSTNRPANLGIGHLTARWIVGRLSASGYGPTHPGTTHRLAISAMASLAPRGVPGLEVGVSRFFHLYDSASVRDLGTVLLPVSELLKDRIVGIESGAREYNQVASLFVRVAPPDAPLEVYGELLRDDHNVNLRDAILEPDHSSAYLLGLRRVTAWGRDSTERRSLTIEIVNGRYTHLHRVRPQAPIYTHTRIYEGHTHNGLVLGSAAALGGGGVSTEWRRQRGTGTERRGWTVGASVVRVGQNMEGGTFRGAAAGYYTIEIAREAPRRGSSWLTSARLEPGFGDLRGVNFGIGARVTR